MTFKEKFVINKLNTIKNYLIELEDLLKFTDKEILSDLLKLHTAERLLQLIVDTIIDINQHFIRELNLQIGDDFQSTFYALKDNKILSENFANKIAPAVGLRNMIVHRYEKLDKALFIALLRKNYADFKLYLKYINDYLKTKK